MIRSGSAVVKSVHVKCSPPRAFEVWTRRTRQWWPGGHRPSGDPASTIVWEERVGGRIYERHTDGREFEWGRVTRWSPPDELAFDFYFGGGASAPSHVTVRFTADGRGTRVEIRHEAGRLSPESWGELNGRYAEGWAAATAPFAELIEEES